MKKIKNWLINKYLPAWAKESILEENAKLKEQIKKLTQDINLKQQYINGMQFCLKRQNFNIHIGRGGRDGGNMESLLE